MDTKVTTHRQQQVRSVTVEMADQYGMEPAAFEATVRAVCLPTDRKTGRAATREEFAAFLLVAKHYNLNPLTREIYGFLGKNGVVQAVVGVDGWMQIINEHPMMDGIEFEEMIDEGELLAITCRIWRKDRKMPCVVTEYMDECRRDIDTWRQWPRRMLRHKAVIQCARYAFGFSGITEPDEAERGMVDVTPPSPARALTPPSAPKRSAVSRESPRHYETAAPTEQTDAAASPAAEGSAPRPSPDGSGAPTQSDGDMEGQEGAQLPLSAPPPAPAPANGPPTSNVRPTQSHGGEAESGTGATTPTTSRPTRPTMSRERAIKMLSEFNALISSVLNSRDLAQRSEAYWYQFGGFPDEGTKIGRYANELHNAHLSRVKGTGNPGEADAVMRRIEGEARW